MKVVMTVKKWRTYDYNSVILELDGDKELIELIKKLLEEQKELRIEQNRIEQNKNLSRGQEHRLELRAKVEMLVGWSGYQIKFG